MARPGETLSILSNGWAFCAELDCWAAVVSALRSHTERPFDVHLMMDPVMPYVATSPGRAPTQ
ncbi:MAG: hypothetical protein CM1200mP4_0030 [Rhodospirillaceae bacterium]|nr:MAG: hypothetical protein CM1200mP4_0030 [Rhodospirillaceae bacterium]